MPTLLVTRKMSPELAARVQASVQGRRAKPGARLKPSSVSLLRLGLLLFIVSLSSWLGLSIRGIHRETEAKRAVLLERAKSEAEGIGPEELDAVTRISQWLTLFSGGYAGDSIADELRAPGAFAKTLAQPAVYVRGPLSGFGGPHTAETAAGSYPDALVLCLVQPPAERTEKLLRSKARASYTSREAGMRPAAHVERLFDAFVGLPLLGAEWQQRVAEAGSTEVLTRLEQRFDQAPLASAKRAARARYLLLAMDEPGDDKGPTELDGERPHSVRVGLVDLVSKKVLLRLRRPVDPRWASPSTRAELASGIDSCDLALQVHQAVSGGSEVARGR